jgi:mRNA-degrading endonuclease YafQ of YafQ-DinJ toxin-antitoxin module
MISNRLNAAAIVRPSISARLCSLSFYNYHNSEISVPQPPSERHSGHRKSMSSIYQKIHYVFILPDADIPAILRKQPRPQEKKQLKNKLELLAQNPSHPSLRTKRIQDTTDLFECSVNMNIRIIWYYEAEAAQYMLHKITCTGGSASIIEQPALSAVHSNS